MDVVIDYFPEACPWFAQSDSYFYGGPYYRHQIFGIPKPTVDITEYRLFAG